MISTKQISKNFGKIKAVDQISLDISDNSIFGLAGTNGAGKSTFLRLLSGVLKPDEGEILVDDMPVWEREETKKKIFFLPDNAYFPQNATGKSMADFYSLYYEKFDKNRFRELAEKLDLDVTRKVQTLSKGMKRQVSMLLGICAGTKYLFCDETFDGLDPVMRQAAKSILAYEVTEREFTPIIASHNLRELEDICDHVGLLHQGGILLSRDLEDLKSNLHKVQLALEGEDISDYLRQRLEIMNIEKRGSLYTVTAKGDLDIIMTVIRAKEPVFCESLPLSLEEIFISETGVHGYDIKNLIL